MNKLILLGIAATLGAAKLAFLPANPPVDLQPTSPGTLQTGHLNISGTATVGLLKSKGTVFGESTAPTGYAYGGFFTAASNQGRGFYGFASSPSGLTYGGFFQNASESGRAVYGLATSTTGFNYGGYFQTASDTGRGVIGVAASPTGTTYGVLGKAVSPTGYGVFSDGTLGVNGKVVVGTTTAAPVVTSRARFYGDGSSISLYAQNGPISFNYLVSAALGGQATGSSYQIGALGEAKSTNGNSVGLYGVASGSKSNFAVYGTAIGGTTDYAGYFSGLLYAASSSAGVKAFMIDHPLDPENKVLSHSSVESDERLNVYRGVVTTDARGYATVSVPAWFEALNEDILYQLTVLDYADSDSFTLAKVVQDVKSGKFKIRSSTPRARISWQVTGRRHDPTSKAYPLQVERMKNADERGKYYAPEAYGKDESMGMGYLPVESGAASKHPPNPPSTK